MTSSEGVFTLDKESFADRTQIYPRIVRRWCLTHLEEVRKISFPDRNYYFSLSRLTPFCTNDAVWEKLPPVLVEKYRDDPLFARGEITMATGELTISDEGSREENDLPR